MDCVRGIEKSLDHSLGFKDALFACFSFVVVGLFFCIVLLCFFETRFL